MYQINKNVKAQDSLMGSEGAEIFIKERNEELLKYQQTL